MVTSIHRSVTCNFQSAINTSTFIRKQLKSDYKEAGVSLIYLTWSSTAATMKIVVHLVILTLSLLLVNADQYCDKLIRDCNANFKTKCLLNFTVDNCCGLKLFSSPSGIYKLRKGAFDTGDAYCDMNTAEGGWLVIQRNTKDSKLTFNRGWKEYEEGFGDLKSDFWYGLKQIRCLVERGQWEMRIDYQSANKAWTYLHYTQFSVGSASDKYPLTVGGFTGVGSNLFAASNTMKFSTPGKDNDIGNCAASYKSEWWFNACHGINPNQQPPYPSLLATSMKIRPKNCIF